jgi:dihydroxy-acid dehydratase
MAGRMLDALVKGKRRIRTIIRESRRLLAEGKIDYPEFMKRACAARPVVGHRNTGTASIDERSRQALG